MMLNDKKVPIVDFRHFFAAMAESYDGAMTAKSLLAPFGGAKGGTLLLGVGNEVLQCLEETATSDRHNPSCFSFEDLGSNRLGADFGMVLKIRRSEAGRTPVHEVLRDFLLRRNALPVQAVRKMQKPTGWTTAYEILAAIMNGIYDVAISKAY